MTDKAAVCTDIQYAVSGDDIMAEVLHSQIVDIPVNVPRSVSPESSGEILPTDEGISNERRHRKGGLGVMSPDIPNSLENQRAG